MGIVSDADEVLTSQVVCSVELHLSPWRYLCWSPSAETCKPDNLDSFDGLNTCQNRCEFRHESGTTNLQWYLSYREVMCTMVLPRDKGLQSANSR